MINKLRTQGLNIGECPVLLVAAKRLKWTSVRMNFSHGEYEYHQSVIDNARKAEQGKSLVACTSPLSLTSSPLQRKPAGRSRSRSTPKAPRSAPG